MAAWAVTLGASMLGWVPFRAASVSDALGMWGKVVDPRTYGSLGLRENTYVVAALTMLAIVGAYGVHTWVAPRLRRRPVASFVAKTAVYTAVFSLVFIFLRPIAQFIYFQF